jgi:hypothetical protein
MPHDSALFVEGGGDDGPFIDFAIAVRVVLAGGDYLASGDGSRFGSGCS